VACSDLSMVRTCSSARRPSSLFDACAESTASIACLVTAQPRVYVSHECMRDPRRSCSRSLATRDVRRSMMASYTASGCCRRWWSSTVAKKVSSTAPLRMSARRCRTGHGTSPVSGWPRG
jgi:hypothetical protein